MLTYLRHSTTPIWLLLVLATGLSWWLGHEADAPQTQRYAASGMILVAAVKIRLVISYFMEARDAPQSLKLVLDGWLLAMIAGILGTYWLGLR